MQPVFDYEVWNIKLYIFESFIEANQLMYHVLVICFIIETFNGVFIR
jgi:hypothetical protein